MGKAVINGKSVEFTEGMTILTAARAAGIYIPSLCDHPALEVSGACRICLVEVENSPKLMAACSTPITEGMVIRSESEKAVETRRGVVELMLLRHPLECFSCTSNGRCALQDAAYELGVESSGFAEHPAARLHNIEDENPFFIRDTDKCVLCGRCIRVCDRGAQYRSIDFLGRGIGTSVQGPGDFGLEESDCKFCGQCVAICPVGALADKPAMCGGRAWELERVRTVCPYCGVGCELIAEVNKKTGRLANVTTDHANFDSVNKGRSCVKGRYAWGFVNSTERLTTPLVKENGLFREASWDEALDLTARGLARNRGSVGFFASARCTNEDNYLMQRFAREVMGTNNVDHCAHL